jgi:hypothetical protein
LRDRPRRYLLVSVGTIFRTDKMFPFRFKSSLILPRNLERYGYEEYVGL